MKRICDLGELPRAGGRAFAVDGADVAVLCTPDGVRAFRNVCPHQGRSMDFAPGELLFTPAGLLMCPHHGACFDPATGACTEGPCRGAALTSLETVRRDGALWLVDGNP